MRRTLILLVACAAVLCAPAGAKHKHSADVSGQFDYYVLSLSWAPVYCEAHPDDKAECGQTRHGFVLHGLWPQYQAGGYPQNCATSNRLDAAAQEFAASVYPSAKLVAHEWDRHGTCSGLGAMDYFKAADSARNEIRIPDALQPGNRVANLAAADISSQLRAANPLLLQPNDPPETLSRFRVLRETFFNFNALEVPLLHDDEANIVIRYHMGMPAEEAASYQTMGFFEGLLELAGAKDVRSSFQHKSWDGDERTMLVIRWTPPMAGAQVGR